ncbi:Transcriptional activator [Aspergillus fumigatus]
MADAIDVGAERPDALAPHPIPVLHVRMRDRSVCILKPRNECRYLKDYVGPAAAVALAKRLHPSPSNLAWDVRPLYDDPLSLHRSVNRTLPQLPPYEFAKRLFWVQYAYIGTIFSLIQPEDFEERLNAVYHHPPDFSNRESCLVYCQVLLVIAYGLMYSVNQWSGDDGPPGFKYFKHALRFLPDIHEEGSIFFVEVLCYVAYYMQNLNRRDAAFLYDFIRRYRTRMSVMQIATDADEPGGLCIA